MWPVQVQHVCVPPEGEWLSRRQAPHPGRTPLPQYASSVSFVLTLGEQPTSPATTIPITDNTKRILIRTLLIVFIVLRDGSSNWKSQSQRMRCASAKTGQLRIEHGEHDEHIERRTSWNRTSASDPSEFESRTVRLDMTDARAALG
jgi:hypothetical protein